MSSKFAFNRYFVYFADNKSQAPMLLTITISIFSLVILNFLLLKFSSNKIVRTKTANKKPIVFKPTIALEQESEKLAPTGS